MNKQLYDFLKRQRQKEIDEANKLLMVNRIEDYDRTLERRLSDCYGFIDGFSDLMNKAAGIRA
ncbi:hypothetical protein [Lactobacillus sp. 3B(2020)]|uniref:hypothetical protein n=1 Tax=Lactobacillus sp. 3B(2020) TaxID=2695882 RepID=UPI0015E012B1|nr:hypothetical protein [Lactobacillus sp. 3B(2020)]QLL70249.1 hypothetical protein GTO83_06720 [Lactobacillus sp. 3B(2020)]